MRRHIRFSIHIFVSHPNQGADLKVKSAHGGSAKTYIFVEQKLNVFTALLLK